ncbi:MAG: ATP-binding protein [Chloroflexota bacterium]|nr:ATP-binding protein [Chloroflexota bacterium]
MKSFFDLHSLPTQIILSFITVVLLTAMAIGLPGIWLIRNQLDQQAWTQVNQGRRAAQALYDAEQKEIRNFAALTAQRPTLKNLLNQGDWSSVNEYLSELQSDTELDLMAVCDLANNILAISGIVTEEETCNAFTTDGIYIFENRDSSRVWMIAKQPIEGDETVQNYVIVGLQLDDEFASQMQEQTGLEHIIWINGEPTATSFSQGTTQLAAISPRTDIHPSLENSTEREFKQDGIPYYAASFPLDETNAASEVVLNVAGITATQNRLLWISLISILAVATLVSIFGIYLTRQISNPLVHLANSAARFSKGDLDSAVDQQVRVREVAEVARALESARVDLLETLTTLEHEKAWVNHLLESIVEGIVTLDDHGHISYFSKGAERITGWSHADVIGSSYEQVFRITDSQQPISELVPAPGKKRKMTVELADGHFATLSFTGAHLAPAEAGDPQVVLVFRDVSEEETIRRIMGQFLANIAHEFRTPLSALEASIELLIDQASDLSESELQELLSSIHLGALGLQTLVDNLLEGASIEAGRFHVSPRHADLGKIIAEAAQTMQPLLDKYDQHLVVEIPTPIPIVYADSRRIVQVLINLLSNAIKFGFPGSSIDINVIEIRGWAKIMVTDRGPGIPHEQKDLVFRRFTYSGSPDTNAKAGVGLGLSVVKAIIEGHGGQIGVDDRPGGGSIFWFTIPLVGEK